VLAFGTLGFAQAAKGKNSDAEQKLTSTEKQLWEAWKNKDGEPFKQSLTDDSVMIDQTGIVQGKDKAIDNLTKTPCEVKSYSLGDIRVSWVDKDTALLTYKAESDATCGGQKVPSPVYASSIWVKKDGKWLTPFHQETAAGTAPAQ
jgi:uncharacterized protein (TIGR02246 family)